MANKMTVRFGPMYKNIKVVQNCNKCTNTVKLAGLDFRKVNLRLSKRNGRKK